MLFTKADRSSPSVKPFRSDLACVVRSLRDQKVPSFQKAAIIQPLENTASKVPKFTAQ